MKIFTTKQIAELDRYTIQNEPISDLDLMERASIQITNWIVQNCSNEMHICCFVGPGNNGGDALAIARQLAAVDFRCTVILIKEALPKTDSAQANLERIQHVDNIRIVTLDKLTDFPELNEQDIILDGLFGAGLTRPLDGIFADLTGELNNRNNLVISIDIPSGLMGEDNTSNNPDCIIKADYTLTFQFPKLSFFQMENQEFVGSWEVLPIGLHPEGIEELVSDMVVLEKEDILELLPQRGTFDHKGVFGHALLIAGSYGKMGAAVLAARAALRSGTGLLTAHVPRLGYGIVQTAVPEAMVSVDQHDSIFTEFPDLDAFSAIGVGPGLDKKMNSSKALCRLLETVQVPLVIDADGINILSEHKDWLDKLPANTILTPHPGEFKRLVGDCRNGYDRLQKQLEFSQKYKVVVVLKGAYTTISTPEGKLWINNTGNPGMATAGSGDVLTGMILGFAAQEMSMESAALLGVYLHGLAGDLAVSEKSEISLVAGDIIESLGQAIQMLPDL